MGKWWKVVGIVLLPITIIFYLIKWIIRKLKSKLIENYTHKISIEKIDNLTGHEFEDFLFYIISQIGFSVTKTKTSGDYGADLIVDTGRDKIAIQCKLYFRQSVGNSAIQEVLGSMQYYNCSTALVITNSKFTKPAIILANNCQINLMDRSELKNFLKSSNKDKRIYLKNLTKACYYQPQTIKQLNLIKQKN